MKQKPPPKSSIISKLRAWSRRQKAASQKRRSEYLYLSGDNRWRRLLINLHPESLFSFFTSQAGVWFVFKFFMTVFLISLLAATFAYFYYRREVPATVLELQSCIEGQVTKFYDRTGEELLWTIREGSECERIQLSDVSPYFVDALISIEDKDFFEHPGYKLTSIARSFVNNILGRPVQGGSTITQQYIKNSILQDSDRSYERKIKEIVLVPEIESVYSKEEILTAYLNTISFGSFYNGIEAASKGYFGKSAAGLTLDESALLVASIAAPNIIWDESELHLKRRDIVLDEMLKDGKISQKEHREASAIDSLAKIQIVDAINLQGDIIAPYFVSRARYQLNNLLCQDAYSCANLQKGGYEIITTLDLQTQQTVEETIAKIIDRFEEKGYDNAALVVLNNHSKEVLALNGGRDFYNPDFGQIDQIIAERYPKEIWHPLIYASLLENNPNWGAGRTLYDYKTFNLVQTDDFLGPVSLRQALGESILTPTIKAAHLADPQEINQLANRLRLADITDCQKNCAVYQALGDSFTSRLDNLANLYATFADEGRYQDLGYIKQVSNSYGQIIYERKESPYKVFDPQTAFMINHILADDDFKPAGLRGYPNLAFKTDLSKDFRDNPFIAYTPQITLGGWIGEQLPKSELPDKDSLLTKQAQSTLVEDFLENYAGFQEASWKKPDELQIIKTNPLSGRIVPDGSRVDYYSDRLRLASIPSTTTVQIDRVTGKLATDCTPKSALKELATSALWPELPDDDPAYRTWTYPIWKNLGFRLDSSIPIEIDDLHKCSDSPPEIDVKISGDCRKVCQLTIKTTAGTHDLKTINIKTGNNDSRNISNDVSGRSAEITYSYENKQTNVRVLRIEIVDRALYVDSFIIDL